MKRIVPHGKLTGIDWNGVYVQSVDPYVVWADLTDGRGLQARTELKAIPVLVKILDKDRFSEASGELGDIRVCPAYDADKDRFFTAKPKLEQVEKLVRLVKEGVIRFDLAAPLETRSGAGSRVEDVGLAFPDENRVPLSGKVMAIIDYGCPLAHEHFRKYGSKESRIRYLWDQSPMTSLDPKCWHSIYQTGGGVLFTYGAELGPLAIESLLGSHTSVGGFDEDAIYSRPGFEVMQAASSHGAHVMDVAAGWPNPLRPEAQSPDDAGKSDIIFVQLGQAPVADSTGGWMNANVLDALRYITKRTTDGAEVVVNLSYGNYAGPHDGSSLFEQAIDWVIDERRKAGGRFQVVIAAGNSFNAACHASFELDGSQEGKSSEVLHWEVMPDDPTDSFLELWYSADVELSVSVTAVRHP